MERNQRMLITAYHEVGHLMLIFKFNNDFPKYHINIEGVKLFFENNTELAGTVLISHQSIKPYSTPEDVLEGLIRTDLAGYASPTMFYNITYNKEALREMTDYISAYGVAEVLSEIYKSSHKEKISPEDIIQKQYRLTREYLLENKETVHVLGLLLYDNQEFTKENIINIKRIFEL